MSSAYKPFVNYRTAPVRVGSPEAFTVSGGLALLAEAPADPSQYPVTVTVGGQSRTRVTNWPQTGQFRILTQTISTGTEFLPVLQFSQADEGASGACDYYGTGTILSAQFFSMFVSFMTPLVNVSDESALPPATLDQTQRGRKGDVAYTVDGMGYFSDGTQWVPFFVRTSASLLFSIGQVMTTALDAGYVGPSFFDWIVPNFDTSYDIQSDVLWEPQGQWIGQTTFGASFGLRFNSEGIVLAQSFGYTSDSGFAAAGDFTLAQALGMTLDSLFYFLGDPPAYAAAFALAVDAVGGLVASESFGTTQGLVNDAVLDWAASPASYAATYDVGNDASYVLLTGPLPFNSALDLALDSALDWAAALPSLAATLGFTEDAALDWAVALPNLAASIAFTEDGAWVGAGGTLSLDATIASAWDAVQDDAGAYTAALAAALSSNAVQDEVGTLPNLASTHATTEDGVWAPSAPLFAADVFNRADSASLGGNWATITGLGSLQISGGAVAINGSGAQGNYWNAGSPNSNDQFSEIWIDKWYITFSSGYNLVSPAVRVSTGANTFYAAVISSASDGNGQLLSASVQIVKSVNGTVSNVGSSVGVPTADSVIRLEVSGTTLTVKAAPYPGAAYSTITSTTDSSIASGTVGLYASASSGLAKVLNWSGGDLGIVQEFGTLLAYGWTASAVFTWVGDLAPAATMGLSSDGEVGSALALAVTNALSSDGEVGSSLALPASTMGWSSDGTWAPPSLLAVSDNFNRANGGLGSNWTTFSVDSAPQIASNALGAPSGTLGARWSANTFANNQYAELAVPDPSASNSATYGPAVRMSSSQQTLYYVIPSGTDDGKGTITVTLTLYKTVSGSTSILGTYTFNTNWSGVVRLEASGTTITVKTATTHGGTYTARITATDSAIASGYAGLRATSTGVAGADNWYGGEL